MNNELQEHHVMLLEHKHPSGIEEWYCPICGRRFLMQWPPNYKKIILEPGDEYAIHSGAKGGFQMNDLEIKLGEMEQETDIHSKSFIQGEKSTSPLEDHILAEEDKARLIVWEKWLEKSDFDSLWSKED